MKKIALKIILVFTIGNRLSGSLDQQTSGLSSIISELKKRLEIQKRRLDASHSDYDSNWDSKKQSDYLIFLGLVQSNFFLEREDREDLRSQAEKRIVRFRRGANQAGSILERYPDFANRECDNSLPLAVAIINNNNPLFDVLVKSGGDLRKTNGRSKIPLAFLAAHYANLHAFAEITKIDEKSVFAVSSSGNTVLHQLLLSSDEILSPLLENPAEERNALLDRLLADKNIAQIICVQDQFGRTALHLAAGLNEPKLLNKILQQIKYDTAIFLLQDRGGYTAFDYAVKKKNKDAIKLFFENPRFGSLAYIDKEVLIRLVSLDVQGLNLNELLLFAIRACPYLSIPELLLSLGSTINAKFDEGLSVLHYAVLSGCPTKVKWVLAQQGVNLEAVDDFGNTALHLAVKNIYCNCELTKILVESGANLNAKNKDGKTPLQVARDLNYFQVVKYLSQADGCSCSCSIQ